MSEEQRGPSTLELMNDVLSTIRDYYDSEYTYYIEKTDDDITTIYEWCAKGIESQRDQLKLLDADQWPKWLRQDMTDLTGESYSVSYGLDEEAIAVLAAVNVHRGGCDIALLRSMLPYLCQAIVAQKLQKQQEYLSYHDDLTGLLNRNSFVSYLDNVDPKKLKSLGTVSLDINGLKVFNKEFGRDYGDEIVTRVGEVLSQNFRGGDVYRMTGDEYLVIVEDISYEDLVKEVNAIREKMDNISLGLTAVGYSWEKIDIDVGDLVTRAENMMREEKQKYYKNVEKGHHEPVIKQDLVDDIEGGNFIVCLVPVLDAKTEDVVGAEAVVRYHHKDIGIMDPGRYLNLLEETGLSHLLDLYVFEEACKTLQKWERDDMPMIPISVNFAEDTLRYETITEEMQTLIKKYHVSCEYLQVCVSESGYEMNQGMLAEISNKIRKANVRVILNHFGSKESSLTILSVMEFDGLKLDPDLAANLLENSRNQIVAKAIIDICHKLGASTYADGVETQDQMNILEEMGCDYVQGTLFNKPITIDTFETRYMKG